jgi:hypothetical protein
MIDRDAFFEGSPLLFETRCHRSGCIPQHEETDENHHWGRGRPWTLATELSLIRRKCSCLGGVEGIWPPSFDDATSKAIKDAELEEALRLFDVGGTRVKATPGNGRPGRLFITYAQQMPAKDAYGANVAFKTKSGMLANLLPSRFISELGRAAPAPIKG